MNRDPLLVALLAYDGLCTFEFGILVELFGLERPELERWYQLRVCAVEAGPLKAAGGVRVEAPYTLRGLDRAGTILIPGWRRPFDDVPRALIAKLHKAHQEGARLLSVCSGAFALAATGLLDGRRATTHWRYSEELAALYPEVIVTPDVLYVDEGNLLTSAGSAAGIDLGLHLIRRDMGAEAAHSVARRLVVPPHREGGQRQFIEAPLPLTGDGLAELLDELRSSLYQDHSVPSMAARVHMTERTFARRFKQETGTTPHRWLIAERVAQAQALLETTDLSMEEIAQGVGFGEAQLLRKHLHRIVGVAPSTYRSNFRRGRP